VIDTVKSTGTAPTISPGRLKAQRRQLEINGKDSLPLSARFTVGQSAEAMVVRAELLEVVAERLQMLADGNHSAAAAQELFERSNRLRVKLNQLTL
jgi:hypothetical protein